MTLKFFQNSRGFAIFPWFFKSINSKSRGCYNPQRRSNLNSDYVTFASEVVSINI